MTILEQILEGTKSVTILGHIRPNDDCLGFALGFCNYLRPNHPDIRVVVYLEESFPKSNCLKGHDKIRHRVGDACYEPCVYLDSDDIRRLGDFKYYLDRADKSPCLDHHMTNARYGGTNVVPDEASSTCEVLFGQLNEEKIDRHTAECLYTDVIHDIGTLKFSCTLAHTIEIAGKLMEKGVDFGATIDNSSYRKTHIRNQILGRALLESTASFGGWYIFSVTHQDGMEFHGVDDKDLNGIIDQLRLTGGMEVAIFIYETGTQGFKVSMRSRYLADVSRTTVFSEGGGHVRAVGCTMSGSIYDVTNNLSIHIVGQLDAISDGQE